MARKNSIPTATLSPIFIGNCEVLIEGATKNFKCVSLPNSLQISASRSTKVKISAVEDVKQIESKGISDLNFTSNGKEEGTGSYLDCQLMLINPKDADSQTKSLLQEILCLYLKELPAMKYAANTGKQSSFLEKCVSSGSSRALDVSKRICALTKPFRKFCTLVLRLKPEEGSVSGKVVAAITYQIIPADAQYAEIPLGAVASTYQHKGIGRFLYSELSKRLENVGTSTVLCWGDKESEGFWYKQGFVPIAEVGTKGKARRLPIRADIRRALCFPGGSTLMVSHLNKYIPDSQTSSIKLWLKAPEKPTLSTDEFYNLDGGGEGLDVPTLVTRLSAGQESTRQQINGTGENNLAQNNLALIAHETMNTGTDEHSLSSEAVAKNTFATYEQSRKRSWEASSSSLKSKRIKASQLRDCGSYPDSVFLVDKVKDNSSSNPSLMELERIKSTVSGYIEKNVENCTQKVVRDESQANGRQFNIMLMDIADGNKKVYLTKIIWDLGGAVTTDGRLCTHVLTGKARRTLNFCTALCSGAWIVSPNWLKQSFREGMFVDEVPFILKDDEYQIKFRVELKEAVLRARKDCGSLLKGYRICLTTHLQPPVETVSAIVRSAGGDVSVGLGEGNWDKTQTIFLASEEDMEEALVAVRSGIRTFSSEWFMNCIMKQELDLDAPQFAESL